MISCVKDCMSKLFTHYSNDQKQKNSDHNNFQSAMSNQDTVKMVVQTIMILICLYQILIGSAMKMMHWIQKTSWIGIFWNETSIEEVKILIF